ncbi:MAG: sulfurtransferase TusA family protein, partial [Nitrospirota bacterium]
LGPKDTTPEFAHAKIAFTRGFVESCKAATEQIGKDLKLSQAGQIQGKTEGADKPAAASPGTRKSVQTEAQPAATVSGSLAGAAAGAAVFDLRGVMCPLNYVKTKLKLEMMDAGERLEVWLDAGDPIKNVPMSLRNDGHKILAEEPLEPDAKHFKVLVEKVES